jgi:hypothetical protein
VYFLSSLELGYIEITCYKFRGCARYKKEARMLSATSSASLTTNFAFDLWVMLTGVYKTMIKEIKNKKFQIENNIFRLLKS